MHLKLFVHLFLFQLFVVLLNEPANAFTNETDRQALLVIKDQINSDPFHVFNSWNASSHFCKWQGVTCSRRHQRVTVLDLKSLNLVGVLSPHIANLTFLRDIHLGNNFFHGIIPQEISRLVRLRTLNLASNSFQGELPSNLTHFSKLEIIHLLYNNLGGKVPVELGSLPKLSWLTLSRNNFTGFLPPSLGNLSILIELSLAFNNLEGTIPVELGRLSNLDLLQLTGNKFSGEVPVSIYNTSSITFFSVSFNSLHGQLPPDLGLTLPKLQEIYVGKNQLSGPIPPSLVNASELKFISFSNNALTGPVPSDLGNLQNLEYLEIGGNLLSDDRNKDGNDLAFLRSLTNCINLGVLRATKNGLKGVIPNSITNLSTKLTVLRLDENHLSGTIPPRISNLINLVHLALNDNMFFGSIPDSIGEIIKLQRLDLSKNTFSGKIPTSIGNFTSLSTIILGDNKLQGEIPISLANSSRLQGLDLSRNNLTGPIPVQVIGLSSLSLAVYLASNHFTGSLPAQVGNLKTLGQLDVAENELSGEIPNTIGSCLMLEYLHMEGNRFQGTLPLSFEQLKNIQILDLSRNNLSGQIPQFLENLSYISYLNLSFNSFNGEVPNKGVFRNMSKFSILGNHELCGGIGALQLPPCPMVDSNRKRKHIATRGVVLIACGTVFFTVLSACVCAFFCLRRRPKQEPSSPLPMGIHYMELSYGELFKATDGFSSANLIGEGSFGAVYRGILDSDQEKAVAIKVFNLQERGANKSFLAECEALKNIRHRNLVKIISCCSSINFKSDDFKALVYEFMPNGSLESWLHPNSLELHESLKLNLLQRLNIAIDVGAALDYLHHHCHAPIIHCDLKPSNILLDNDLTAHVSDFGLSRLLSSATTTTSSQSQTSSQVIRGTLGYVAPEYGMSREVSVQGDAFSYGIVLLELFTGKRPTDRMFTSNLNLHGFVSMALPNQVPQIVDPQLIQEEETESSGGIHRGGRGNTANLIEKCLVSMLGIGVSCSAESPRDRMDIKDAVNKLHAIKNSLIGPGRG